MAGGYEENLVGAIPQELIDWVHESRVGIFAMDKLGGDNRVINYPANGTSERLTTEALRSRLNGNSGNDKPIMLKEGDTLESDYKVLKLDTLKLDDTLQETE